MDVTGGGMEIWGIGAVMAADGPYSAPPPGVGWGDGVRIRGDLRARSPSARRFWAECEGVGRVGPEMPRCICGAAEGLGLGAEGRRAFGMEATNFTCAPL